MKTLSNDNSAQLRQETPHSVTSPRKQTISKALRRRAESLINDRTIDAAGRIWIRYALEINDAAGLAELVRRADAGEPLMNDSHLQEANNELSTKS